MPVATSNIVTQLTLAVKLSTPIKTIEEEVAKRMYKEVVRRLGSQRYQNDIRRGVRKILKAHLQAQPEFLDMIAEDGVLRGELGVPDAKSAMHSLVRDWIDSTEVILHTPVLHVRRITGKLLSIKAIKASYADVLKQAYATYTSKNGQNIPWLKWLLTKGTEILITTHRKVKASAPGILAASRTKNTIMIKSKNAGWGVPEEYSGTRDDNFATRAVFSAMPEIIGWIETETMRRF